MTANLEMKATGWRHKRIQPEVTFERRRTLAWEGTEASLLATLLGAGCLSCCDFFCIVTFKYSYRFDLFSNLKLLKEVACSASTHTLEAVRQ